MQALRTTCSRSSSRSRNRPYRPDKNLAYYRTLQALPLIFDPARKDAAVYLDACRIKRNTVEYDAIGGATAADADELIQFATELQARVLKWLKATHPELMTEEEGPGRSDN